LCCSREADEAIIAAATAAAAEADDGTYQQKPRTRAATTTTTTHTALGFADPLGSTAAESGAMADVHWIREPQILSDSGHLEPALVPDGIHPSDRDKNDRAESQESGDNNIIFASFFQCSQRFLLVPSSGFLACSLEFSSNDILLCFAERRRRKEGRVLSTWIFLTGKLCACI
jgi:hypothetical protein